MGNPLIPVPQQDDGQRWREGRRYRTISNDIEFGSFGSFGSRKTKFDPNWSLQNSCQFLSSCFIMFISCQFLSCLSICLWAPSWDECHRDICMTVFVVTCQKLPGIIRHPAIAACDPSCCQEPCSYYGEGRSQSPLDINRWSQKPKGHDGPCSVSMWFPSSPNKQSYRDMSQHFQTELV